MTFIENAVTVTGVAAHTQATQAAVEAEATALGLYVGTDWRGLPALAELDAHRLITGSSDLGVGGWMAGVGYANAIRDELPDAVAVLDAFHVVRLGTQVVDEVRRRVQQDNHRAPRPQTRPALHDPGAATSRRRQPHTPPGRPTRRRPDRR